MIESNEFCGYDFERPLQSRLVGFISKPDFFAFWIAFSLNASSISLDETSNPFCKR